LAFIEAGRVVYAEQSCARCHSIGGRGNPRSPLDGVGARLSEEEIRRWITPSPTPAKGFQSRHAKLELTIPQREALLAYLRSLRNGAPTAK
jgi:mono/diheme cytochrome c family protein